MHLCATCERVSPSLVEFNKRRGTQVAEWEEELRLGTGLRPFVRESWALAASIEEGNRRERVCRVQGRRA